jgi:hypothetical protein
MQREAFAMSFELCARPVSHHITCGVPILFMSLGAWLERWAGCRIRGRTERNAPVLVFGYPSFV